MSALSRLLGKKKNKKPRQEVFPRAFTDEDRASWAAVKPYTMTDKLRVLALIHAVKHVLACNIQGEIVECGVWKGGSMMTIARTLLQAGVSDRNLWLFDTFEGMPAPTARDRDNKNTDVQAKFASVKFQDRDGSDWCYSPLDEVKANVQSTGYPSERVRYVKGKVEDTLPGNEVGSIALLRLDTDFYESTKSEMHHLYPKLAKGGILILDDYYTWQGSREAVEEYFAGRADKPLLVTVGGGGAVVGAKP